MANVHGGNLHHPDTEAIKGRCIRTNLLWHIRYTNKQNVLSDKFSVGVYCRLCINNLLNKINKHVCIHDIMQNNCK